MVAPTTGYWINFVRADDGKAICSLFQGDTKIKTAPKAAWDDAIPFGAGDYDAVIGANFPARGGPNLRFVEGQVPGRNGILLHPGLADTSLPYQYGSFGCLNAFKGFILDTEALLQAAGQTHIPIRVVNQLAPYHPPHIHIGLTLTATKAGQDAGDTVAVKKGDVLTCHVNLTGDPNGVSKDCLVFLQLIPHNAKDGIDFVWKNDPHIHFIPQNHAIANAAHPDEKVWGYYIELNKHAQHKELTHFNVRILTDKGQSIEFKIKNYLFDSPNHSGPGHRYYSDHEQSPKILIKNGGDPDETLSWGQSLDNLNINVSGGQQGFHKTFVGTPGATYHVDFEPFSIPDSISVRDKGHSYIHSGYISDDNGSGPLSQDFTIDPHSDGRISIDVLGSGPGTSWNLHVGLL